MTPGGTDDKGRESADATRPFAYKPAAVVATNQTAAVSTQVASDGGPDVTMPARVGDHAAVSDSPHVTRIAWNTGKPLQGRYVMIQKIGEGGMGTVYLAEDLLLRRKVAVKTLWDDELYEPADIERFRKEVAIAHSVSHPNVARTYDLGETGGVHFITMEYLKGETLMSRIKDGPKLSSKEVRDIAVPMCRGLLAAHRAGIVHRDLKPANIMLCPGERKVAIMDFGIAATFNDKRDGVTATQRPDLRAARSFDVTSAGLGTPVYMAPEQWDQATGDQRTDVYAVGVILYVALTGEAPYHADTADAIGQLHKTAPVPDIAAKVPDADKDLVALIRDCLAKRPEQRPQSMIEVLERLERRERRAAYARQLGLGALGAAAALFLVGLALYELVATAIVHELRPSMRRLATIAAAELTESDLEQVKGPADVRSPAFRRITAAVERTRSENPEIRVFYVMRTTSDAGRYQYVFDQDADFNGDGRIGEDERGHPPGDSYDGKAFPGMARALATGKAHADDEFTPDPEEPLHVLLSAYAPVPLGKKEARYFIGVDATSEPLNRLQLHLVVALSLAFAAVVATLAVLLSPARRLQRTLRADGARKPVKA